MTEFLGYTSTVGMNVLILFIMIAVGFIISKKKLINADGAAQITNILLYLVTPCVIINSFESMELNEKAVGDLIVAVICACVTHLVGFAISFLIFRKDEQKLRTILINTATLSNCGFMGIPMSEALLGSQGVFLTSVYIAVFNVFVWTRSYSMFSGGKFSIKKAILNPGVLSTLLGLIIFFTRVQFPNIIESPVRYIAGVNSPLAMIVIGFYLSATPLKITKDDSKMFLSIALRLLAVPIICLALFRFAGVRGNLLTACIISAAAPTAALVMMFAAKSGYGTQLASKSMAYSYIFSIVTMPLILTVCQMLI